MLDTARLGQLSLSDQAALVQSINGALNIFTRVLTGCGGGHRDTDGAEFYLFGDSPNTAGAYDGDDVETTAAADNKDHAIFRVSQLNPNAGETSNPRLYAAIFEGPVKFTHAPKGTIRFATASANWVNAVHPATPTVAATDDATGDALVIDLYRSGPDTDPNVRVGYAVPYALDSTGAPFAVYSYSSLKIGFGTFWTGAIADIPAGWQLCNGTNGTPDLRDRFLVCAGLTYAVEATGGAVTHTHSVSGTVDSDGIHTHTVPSSGTHTHSGTTAFGGDHAHGGTTVGSGTLVTDLALAAISIADHASHSHGGATEAGGTGNTGASGTGATGSSVIGSIPDHGTHTHVVGLPGTQYDITGVTGPSIVEAGDYTSNTESSALTHDVTGTGHTHTGPSHTHSGPSHTHVIPSQAAMSHSITDGISGIGHGHNIATHFHGINASGTHDHTFSIGSSGAHTHTTDPSLTHQHTFSATTGFSSSLPPYYALAFIQRID